MAKLTPQQAEEIIELIEEASIADAFYKLVEYGIRSSKVANLRNEYISGKDNSSFSDRLKAYVNSLVKIEKANFNTNNNYQNTNYVKETTISLVPKILSFIVAVAAFMVILQVFFLNKPEDKEEQIIGKKNPTDSLEEMKQIDTLYKFKKDEKYGFMNQNNEVIILAKYDEVWDFKEQRAAVKLNNKRGYIDEKGNEVISLIYDEVREYFDSGITRVKKKNQYSFIDKNGKCIKDCN